MEVIVLNCTSTRELEGMQKKTEFSPLETFLWGYQFCCISATFPRGFTTACGRNYKCRPIS
jgi:hypothetical protein